MDIPVVNYCYITKGIDFDDMKEWLCFFRLKDDPFYYKVYLVLEGESEQLYWRLSTVLKRKNNHWGLAGIGIETKNHVFEQLVRIIVKHSKDRLRFLRYQEKNYLRSTFKPLSEYKEPKRKKIIG